MKNPLNKRLPRELKRDIGKYIALFLFLAFMISFVSGFIVADGSMMKAYDDSFEKYSIENGHFIVSDAIDDGTVQAIESGENIVIEPIFYKEMTLSNGHVVRAYKNRTGIDGICLMSGAMPQSGQIAADRLYLENNGLKAGDKLGDYIISGAVAFSDYSALFKKNTDMMFDANKFTVAIVTDADFDAIDENLVYCYAWRNNDQSLSKNARHDKAEEVESAVSANAELTDLIERDSNQAITFTGEDMGSDKSMMETLLYVVVVILGFVFAVTTRSTIEQESGTIGTLLASGYTRGELIRHYMTMPLLVTIAAAIVGNILGYTVYKFVVVSMYYHSYSLPTYKTIWSSEAFLKTTVLPCILIAAVVYLVLRRTMSMPILSFLRRDMGKSKNKSVPTLRTGGIMSRYRKRVIMQNKSAYITLFIGIFFANLLLLFGLIMPPILSNFKAEALDTRMCDYEYILKTPALTSDENAEAFCINSLEYGSEDISVYGIHYDSRYFDNSDMPAYKTNVLISDGFAEKYGLHRGDEIVLKEKFGGKEYKLTVMGTKHYSAELAVFMDKANFNALFDLDPMFFNAYFSNKPLDDLDKSAVSTVITQQDLTIIADQLNDSMGRIFPLTGSFAVALYMLLVYLLSKMVLDKNARSISMLKILGYSRREISSLYNSATAIVVAVSLVITIPLSIIVMKRLYYYYMAIVSGWLTFYVAPWIPPAMLLIGGAAYYLMHLLGSRRLDKIPMSQALKTTE